MKNNEGKDRAIQTLSDLLQSLDSRLQNVEKMQLTTFSYLLNSDKDIIQSSYAYTSYLTDMCYDKSLLDAKLLKKEIVKLSSKIESTSQKVNYITEQLNEIINKKSKRKKRKHPLFYFFTKRSRYNKIQKQREILRIEREKLFIEQERERNIRKKIEEENKIIKRKKDNDKIKEILSSIKD